ncbi:high mobility group B protein 10 [Tanacetum coccineum]|uniref:High mobility group B protein 10 n=1 Tax=Tanacetum coccineum TaxID=301880 RepID=A0ABQ4ZI65_9ASTR
MAETRSIDEVYEELMAEFYQIDADKEAARKANKKGKQMVEDRGRGSDSLPSCLDVQKPLIPIIGGSSLDLHRLFIEVTSRGGFEKIVSDRRWREVMVVFKFGPTITNASFVLRKAYLSLLYHFEQVYFFRKKSPTLLADSANRLSYGPVSLVPSRICYPVEVGGQVTGTIDNRFEQGYLVTVDLGNEKLSGFIYHLPSDASAPSHGTENMNQLALREPSPPEHDSSGYNVFYSEHYGRLKPLYHGQEDVICKRIQVLWETLTQEFRLKL